MSDSVLELIEMLEGASEGSQRLDAAIYVATTKEETPAEAIERMRLDLGREPSDAIKGMIQAAYQRALANPPRYTTSIDAALRLIPRGAVWHLQTDYGGLNRANVGAAGRPSASIYNANERELFAQADAETPALALCVAALKARQA